LFEANYLIGGAPLGFADEERGSPSLSDAKWLVSEEQATATCRPSQKVVEKVLCQRAKKCQEIKQIYSLTFNIQRLYIKAKRAEEIMSEKLVATPINLSAFIDYQKGSVVSKEILGKKTGTVTVFAFDEGQGLSEHTSPYDAMVQILDGSADIFIAGKKYKVSAGEMIIMPAGKPHSLKAGQRFKMMLVLIRTAD
jgi:quercetin dioxygenase-like cupin family protein